MFSYIVLGHYPVTDSNGTRLKLNYDFKRCKTIVCKILRSLNVIRFICNVDQEHAVKHL